MLNQLAIFLLASDISGRLIDDEYQSYGLLGCSV